MTTVELTTGQYEQASQHGWVTHDSVNSSGPVNGGGNDSEVNVTKRSELNWNETGEPAQFQSRVVPSLVLFLGSLSYTFPKLILSHLKSFGFLSSTSTYHSLIHS